MRNQERKHGFGVCFLTVWALLVLTALAVMEFRRMEPAFLGASGQIEIAAEQETRARASVLTGRAEKARTRILGGMFDE